MSVDVTQRADFECAYLMKNFGNQYKLNAHRYRIEVTVVNVRISEGVAIQFEDLQDILKSVVPDNCFVYSNEGEDSLYTNDLVQSFNRLGVRTVGYPFNICAENLVNYFASILQRRISEKYPNVFVMECKLRESNDSYVSWRNINRYI